MRRPTRRHLTTAASRVAVVVASLQGLIGAVLVAVAVGMLAGWPWAVLTVGAALLLDVVADAVLLGPGRPGGER